MVLPPVSARTPERHVVLLPRIAHPRTRPRRADPAAVQPGSGSRVSNNRQEPLHPRRPELSGRRRAQTVVQRGPILASTDTLFTPYSALAFRARSEMNLYAFSRTRSTTKPADSIARR